MTKQLNHTVLLQQVYGFNTASFLSQPPRNRSNDNGRSEANFQNAFFSCTIENLLSPWIETMPIKQYKPINL